MCEYCKKKPPEPSVCWPDDSDYLDGKTEIELPPERFTKVFWDADILDEDDRNKHGTIIGAQELSRSASASNSEAGCGMYHRRLAVRRRLHPRRA